MEESITAKPSSLEAPTQSIVPHIQLKFKVYYLRRLPTSFEMDILLPGWLSLAARGDERVNIK
jgi:hypothetical protein